MHDLAQFVTIIRLRYHPRTEEYFDQVSTGSGTSGRRSSMSIVPAG